MATSTVEPTTTRRGYPSYSRNIVQRLLVNREAAVIAALVIVYVYSLVNVEFFDGPLTTYNIFKEYAPILLMALPMTLIIITGEIDLSVASTLGVSAACCGVLVKEHDVSMPTAVILTLVLGLVLGAVNGYLVAYVGLPSLAVTIGTLALYRGLAEGLIQTDRIAGFPPGVAGLADRADRRHELPDDRDPRRRAGGGLRACCCTSRPSAAGSTRSASAPRRRTSRASTWPARSSCCS